VCVFIRFSDVWVEGRGVPIWVFLHVPMSDIDSTKNTDNRYSLPIFYLLSNKSDCHSTTCEAILHGYSGSGLGFYYAIQTIIHPQNFYAYSHEAING